MNMIAANVRTCVLPKGNKWTFNTKLLILNGWLFLSEIHFFYKIYEWIIAHHLRDCKNQNKAFRKAGGTGHLIWLDKAMKNKPRDHTEMVVAIGPGGKRKQLLTPSLFKISVAIRSYSQHCQKVILYPFFNIFIIVS